MLHDQKKIHFIGICGVAMSALALAFQKKGYIVTGSDVGFYPPVSTNLKNAGVNFYPGWHPDKVLRNFSEGIQNGHADDYIVVVGNVASSNNAEWQYVQEHHIPYRSYPEIIKDFFVKEHSIVCAGTYGKSTSSAILAWILQENNFDPSYMFGGISLNSIPAAKLADSTYSILEGDEYKSARWDNRPKFAHYSPTHLLLTSVVWDHADVYPTERSYVQTFEDLVRGLPQSGLLVLSAKVIHDVPQIVPLSQPVLDSTKGCSIVTYGKTKENDYQYFDVLQTKHGITFKINHKSTIYNIESTILGDYMADNMTGCFAMAHCLGIEPMKIIKSLATFKNIKRRLEKRYDNSITVFDDIAHSPKKAEAVLRSLKEIYSGKIVAVFEPNSGNRLPEAVPGYDNKFIDADEVIVPRLTAIKRNLNQPKSIEGDELAKIISQTHNHVTYIENDKELINHLSHQIKTGDVIIFLGSHGFRGMIEELVQLLQTKL